MKVKWPPISILPTFPLEILEMNHHSNFQAHKWSLCAISRTYKLRDFGPRSGFWPPAPYFKKRFERLRSKFKQCIFHTSVFFSLIVWLHYFMLILPICLSGYRFTHLIRVNIYFTMWYVFMQITVLKLAHILFKRKFLYVFFQTWQWIPLSRIVHLVSVWLNRISLNQGCYICFSWYIHSVHITTLHHTYYFVEYFFYICIHKIFIFIHIYSCTDRLNILLNNK